ncbi:diacylglycerol kinase (ATP) [Geomicrobium halophilum]|uniref:Diacylglycerol kinase (ATP) n=1 Tax=Geomicrobium halophilum TaxID=549000 RepID=A0A841PWF6_9BACL|nr:diacylglycerol kinase [Geomicrobium halophilum]MBB6450791.1 diacylglycerol kinase (ATP) [Geomicrobium halophilum]
MRRARLIYNPTSGREQMKKHLPYILDRLEQAGYEASAHMTKKEGCAKTAAFHAGEGNYDLVIAAGGDGTIFEVVNGLAHFQKRPRLGIIPAGTTNDLGRAFRLNELDIEGICDVLIGNDTQMVDVGKAGDQYFVNIAAGGSLTELTYDTPSRLKTMLGHMAYYVKGFEKLFFLKPRQARIEYDGKLFEGKIMMFLIANTNSVGGFEKLCPDAELNDGMFDMIIVKKTNLPDFVRIGSLALSGQHINDDKILYVQANRIKMQIEDDMQLNLDGERGGLLPSEFINLRHHFEVLVPNPE